MIKLLVISIIILGIALIYSVGAFIVYGIEFAAWQNYMPEFAKNDYEEDRKQAIATGLLWPIIIFDEDARKDLNNNYKKFGIMFK